MEHEPESSQDARVDSLWTSLDTKGRGYLDLAGLKQGLKKLDHRTRLPSQIIFRVLAHHLRSSPKCR